MPEAVKKRRLQEVIDLQQRTCTLRTQQHLGKTEEFLIEGTSKKNPNEWKGRNTQNTVAVFDKGSLSIRRFCNGKSRRLYFCNLRGTVVGYSE